VPLGVARDAVKIMDMAGRVIEKGYKNAVTDGAVGAMTARTAALAALYNVKINLSSIQDKTFVEEVTREVKSLESEVQQKEEEILSQVVI
jgi:formiminotetrahydrofolate cyclodeaminase